MSAFAKLLGHFANESKSIERGENHHKSSHVELFQYCDGGLRGKIHASMHDRLYKLPSNGKLMKID